MPLDDVQLHLVDDFDSACELMQWMGTRDAADKMGVDTETTGLVVGVDKVRLVQVGGREHGWAIPWERWSGLFEDISKRYTGRVVMHNAKYDYGMLDHMGVRLNTAQIDDTRIMSHILEPNMSTALKSQSGRHVDADAAAAQDSLHKAIGPKGKWDWDTVPITFGPYWQYAALDTVLTVHLDDHHRPLVMADAPESYELELAAQWVIQRMERYGAHIDVPFARKTKEIFDDFVDVTATQVEKRWGVKAGANAAIIKVLQEEGYVFDKLTAAGAFSLDSEVLEGIDHELAELVLRRRRRQKLSSTYLAHFINEVDEFDIIHPSINTLGARTSRMSMERPNLQNLPRKSEKNPDAETIRNCFTTRYEDGTLLMCDFDQIEMRLLAYMAGDQNMINAFLSPDDFFAVLAREIFQDISIQKDDPRRRVTKNMGYAEIYGAGLEKMAKMAGMPIEHMRAVKDRFNNSYAGVPRFKKAIESLAWTRQKTEGQAYARSPITRRRHVADLNKIYALVNWLIQGSAAETFKKKLVELDLAGLGEYMVVPVHDEIVLDVPGHAINDAVDVLNKVMNDTSMFTVPITASVSHGLRWGEKRDWEN